MKILGNKQLLKPPASFITLLDYSKDDHVEYTVTSVQVGLLTIFVLVHLYTQGKVYLSPGDDSQWFCVCCTTFMCIDLNERKILWIKLHPLEAPSILSTFCVSIDSNDGRCQPPTPNNLVHLYTN